MGESRVVRTSACPQCRQRGRDRRGDNLAEYSDGHKFCYSCRLFIPGSALNQHRNMLDKVSMLGVRIPPDASKTIDAKALEWLSQYDITKQEVIRADYLWSPLRQQLIKPLYDVGDHLVAYNAREFSPNAKSRYYSQGPIHEIIEIVNPLTEGEDDDIMYDTPIVLVEDYVSAIKVGRKFRAVSLFGSQISRDMMMRLKHVGDTFVIWLDSDKALDSLKFARAMRQFGLDVTSVFTDLDPKRYNDNEITEIVVSGLDETP